MISKTSGFRGTRHFQTHPCNFTSDKSRPTSAGPRVPRRGDFGLSCEFEEGQTLTAQAAVAAKFWKLGFNGDAMGFNGGLMGFNGGLMGFNEI